MDPWLLTYPPQKKPNGRYFRERPAADAYLGMIPGGVLMAIIRHYVAWRVAPRD